MEEIVLNCCAVLEWANAQNVALKKLNYKNAMLRLVRNDIRSIFIEISQNKLTPTKLQLKNITVHNKFASEGKSTIKFNTERCTLTISNAPTGSLIAFLKTIFIKMASDTDANKHLTKEAIQKKIRDHMLSEKAGQLNEISPVTNAELDRAKKLALSKSTVTTPSPPASKKRRMAGSENYNPKAPKKLYTESPLVKTESQISPMQEELNEEQASVLAACKKGRNVFFTGSAGTGKSFLLKRIISELPPDGLVATGSTGVSACLIGGVTLHSFCSIGTGEAGLKRCFELANRPGTASLWRRCKTLIIDEISMIDGDYFDKIENVAREIRKSDKPFGGIQLILCGDFFQLPPIGKLGKGLYDKNTEKSQKKFCFQSKCWSKCIQTMFELKQVHRQKDPEFVNILNSIRIGRVTPAINERLKSTSKQRIEENGILATQLCSHTNDADLINQNKLDSLQTVPKEFEALDSDSYMTKTLDSYVTVPYKLILKEGAQVMLLKNINVANGLVNGARGVVVRFEDGIPVVKFMNKFEYIAKPEKWSVKTANGNTMTRTQVPLKLAWAFSIHKSQGLTLDCVEMSLSKVFEAGQAYVALSRAQSIKSLRIRDFDAKQVWASPDVLIFYKSFRRKLAEMALIPLGPKIKNQTTGKNKLLTKKMLEKPLLTIC